MSMCIIGVLVCYAEFLVEKPPFESGVANEIYSRTANGFFCPLTT
jgi:hypothetical protein